MLRIALLRSIQIVFAVTLAIACHGAPSPKSQSTGGWGKAHFGMTQQEVISAFSGEVSNVEPADEYEEGKYIAPIEIRDTKVGPVEHARVRFVFPAGASHPRLQRVYVTESVIPPKAGDDIRMRSE